MVGILFGVEKKQTRDTDESQKEEGNLKNKEMRKWVKTLKRIALHKKGFAC
jgi:hypothetical protein